MSNKKAIYLLFAANSISGFAQGISLIAIAWHFTNVLNQPDIYGHLFWIITALSIFWGLYVGTLVDQYNRKKLFLITSIVGAFILLSCAAMGYQEGTVSAVLTGIVFAATMFIFNIHYPTLYAYAQEITEEQHYGKITSYIEIQGQASSAFAGMVAAILIHGAADGVWQILGFKFSTGIQFLPWKMQEIFLLDGITYLIAILLISNMRFQPIAQRHKEYLPMLQRLKMGFQFLIQHPTLFAFGVLSSVLFATVLVINFFLNPVYIHHHLKQSVEVYAMFEFFFALGSLFAGIVIQRFFSKNIFKGIGLLTLISAFAYWVSVWNYSLGLFYFIGACIGFANAGTRVLRVNYMFKKIPNQVIGRTTGVFMVSNTLIRVVLTFIFSFPFFLTSNHIVYAFATFGSLLLLTFLLLQKKFKKMERA